MRIDDYNDFYDKVIKQCIDGIMKYAENLQFDSGIQVRDNSKDKIYKNYQKKRDYVRSNYMSKKTEVSLDRHKVSSCMIYAILKTKPLKINRLVWKLPEKILLANEYLAFFVALNIVELYKIDKMKDENIEGDYQIIIPMTYHEDEDPENTYESNFCKNLYYLGQEGIEKYDVFAYSDILYLLEKYTDTYLELGKAKL